MKIKNILIIEDEDELRTELIEILYFEGYKTMGASDGRQGIFLARKFLPDLIICDILMPNVNGLDVLKSINEFPETEDTPFIFISALSTNENIRNGMLGGADDYLVKPFKIKDLLNSIKIREKKANRLEERINKTIDNLLNNARSQLNDFDTTSLQKVKKVPRHPKTKTSKDNKADYDIDSGVLNLIEINNTMRSLKQIIEKSLKYDDLSLKEKETFLLLKDKIDEPKLKSDNRNIFMMKFKNFKPGFIESLGGKHPDLSRDDLLLCCSIYLKLSGKEISKIFGVETASIYKNRYRIKKKLGVKKGIKLFSYLENFDQK